MGKTVMRTIAVGKTAVKTIAVEKIVARTIAVKMAAYPRLLRMKRRGDTTAVTARD